MNVRTIPMLAVLVLAGSFPARAQETDVAYFDVPLGELSFDEGTRLPDLETTWNVTETWRDRLPYAFLEGSGAAFVFVPGRPAEAVAFEGRTPLSSARLVARVPVGRALRGTLVVPRTSWRELQRLPFTFAGAPNGDAAAFAEAEQEFCRAQLVLGRTGAAWFRHRLRELGGSAATRPEALTWGGSGDDLLATYSLFSGGRAVAENLQLDRMLPADPEDEVGLEVVDLDSLEGITVRELDWTARLGDEPSDLDPLAALVPADQHALFFPRFEAFVHVVDRTSTFGSLLLSGFEQRAVDARTRERLERQLALPLDDAARLLGPLAIASVAVTGSDPYLRSGSDVALLFEAKDPDALVAFLRARFGVAADAAGVEPTSGELDGLAYESVVTGTRSVSAFLARLGERVVVANSLAQLARLRAVEEGAEALGASAEYRFFRQRYRRGAEDESALLVVPDAAIRRWCGPRWRIGASRRTRAAAELAELHAAHADALVRGVEAPREIEGPAWLGALELTSEGVHSSIYGSLAFQTPIVELDFARVTQEEAGLYDLWRDGYQRNWSNYFDPIALRIDAREGRLGLDLTVMPLIVGTEYRDLVRFAGDEALSADDGDPHEEAIARFVLALDVDSPAIRSLSEDFGGLLQMIRADPFAWIGGSIAVFVDDAELWRELVDAGEDPNADAVEGMWERPNDVPLAVTFEVKSGIELAAFLASLRAFIDGAAPGLLQWNTRERDGMRYVEMSDVGGEDVSFFYGVTPDSWTLSLNQDALLAAMKRHTARGKEERDDVPPHPLGESAVLELDGTGVRVIERLLGATANPLARVCWNNLPILAEWRHRFPDEDPMEVHRRVFGEELRCPAGGVYAWDAEWGTMASSIVGHPGDPRGAGLRLTPEWGSLQAIGAGVTFEDDGLRARVVLRR